MTREEALTAWKQLRSEIDGENHLFVGTINPEMVDLAIAALERERWISVKERLPVGGDKSGAVCEDVWMLFDDGSVFCGWMNGCTDTAYYLDGYNDFVLECPITRVMAWQPKPDQPKEETQ